MNRLKELREDKDIIQNDIAKVLGITQTGYSKYEVETNDIPTDVLIKLAKYLETSTDYLLGLTDDDTPIKYMNRNLTNKEKELLERFIYLATEDQLKLIGYADSLNNKVTN